MSGLTCVLLALCHVAFAGRSYVKPEYLDMLRATGQDELFANLMGISDVSLVRPKEGSEGSMFSNVSPLGDILLTNEQEEQARQGVNFDRYPERKWKNGTIPYFISADFSPQQRRMIHTSIVALNKLVSNIRIVNITWTDQDYIIVVSGLGCSSNLGRVGGQQMLSLQSNGCLRVGTIQHEFIHAAGMQHENNRPDRDNNITVLFENISPEWRSQYQKGDASEYDILGPYDYYSVMHYPYLAPGSDKPAFELLDSSIDPQRLGQRDGPTPTDIQKIDTLYM